MEIPAEIDLTAAGAGVYFDELPLWSAPFGRMLLDATPVGRDLAILDVGTGTGFVAIELAERCGPTATVTAVDPWQGALVRLRDKLDFLGIGNVEVVEGDAAVVDLADASFDVIVTNLGIHNFERPRQVLERCWRLARPGATLVATTNLTGHMQELYDAYRLALEDLDLAAALPGLDAEVRRRGTVASISSLLAAAGFEVRRVDEDRFRLRFASGEAVLRHHLIRCGFLAAWKAIVAPDEVASVFSRLVFHLDEVARRRGEIVLTIPMACFSATRGDR